MNNYDGGFGAYEGGGGGGGGFMNSGGSPQKKEYSSFQTVTPLTICMIQTCTQNPSDDSLSIDGKQMQKVVIYGKVLDVINKHTNNEYVVDDGTGIIKIIQYVPDDNQQIKVAELGSYVYINGAIRSVEGERAILAHHMRTVTDHNELTCHLLSVVFTHYQNVRGPLNDGQKLQQARVNTMSFGGNSGIAGGFVIDNPVQQQQGGYYQNQQMGGGAAGGAAGDQSSDWKLVHDAFAADNSTDTGLSVDQVAAQLQSRGFTIQRVRQICESLMNDGYVYSTIDDNHFKSTGSFM